MLRAPKKCAGGSRYEGRIENPAFRVVKEDRRSGPIRRRHRLLGWPDQLI